MTRFDDLWHAHRVAVLGYLIRRTDDPQDAADLLAETYAVIWRRLTSVPASPEDRPWIFGVAANVLANHDRGARRRSRLESALRFEVRGLVVAPVDPAVLALRAALQDLEPLDREVLTLSVGRPHRQRDCTGAGPHRNRGEHAAMPRPRPVARRTRR